LKSSGHHIGQKTLDFAAQFRGGVSTLCEAPSTVSADSRVSARAVATAFRISATALVPCAALATLWEISSVAALC
jgi:hypothetical protein